MITLSFVDYGIIACVLFVLVFRTYRDVHDVVAAKFIKNTMKAFVKRKFSPKLTAIMPLESVDASKQTLAHLNERDASIAVIIVVTTSTHPTDASSLRYFIRKHDMANVRVVTRKNPDPTRIANEYVKTGLVTLLPDTARLHDSFYFDVLLPFSDRTVDAVRYISNVRTDQTLRSGIETLCTAWRQYIGVNSFRRPDNVTGANLEKGVVVRAKFLRAKHRKPLTIIQTRKPVVSVSAQPSNRAMWSILYASSNVADLGVLLVVAAMATLVYNGTHTFMFAAGVSLLLGAVVIWWSLELARVSWADRLSIVLLMPLYFIITLSFVVVRMADGVRVLSTGIQGAIQKAIPLSIRKL